MNDILKQVVKTRFLTNKGIDYNLYIVSLHHLKLKQVQTGRCFHSVNSISCTSIWFDFLVIFVLSFMTVIARF